MMLSASLHTTTDYGLLCGLSEIWYDFGVNFTTAFEYAEHGCFLVSTRSQFAFDAFTTEVGFIDFDLAL